MTEWRTVPDFPDFKINEKGRIFSTITNQIVQGKTDRGRILVYLGHRQMRTVHSLVLAAFVGPRPEGKIIRHINGIFTDNRLTNLAYGTPAENNADQVRHGTHANAAKMRCVRGHLLFGKNVYQIASRPNVRYCRRCRAQHQALRTERRSIANKAARLQEFLDAA